MDMERKNATTLKGNSFTLIGPEIKVGQTAPDFTALAGDLSPVTLASSKGKTRLLVGRIIQLGKTIGKFHARDEEFKAFGESRVVLAALRERGDVGREIVNKRRLDKVLLRDHLESKRDQLPGPHLPSGRVAGFYPRHAHDALLRAEPFRRRQCHLWLWE